MSTVKLSFENTIVAVDREIIKIMATIEDAYLATRETDSDSAIDVIGITAEEFTALIPYLQSIAAKDISLQDPQTSSISNKAKEIIASVVGADMSKLMRMINFADYAGCTYLRNALTTYIASFIKGHTPAEIMQTFATPKSVLINDTSRHEKTTDFLGIQTSEVVSSLNEFLA